MDDVTSRAFAAYFRHNPHGYILDQPAGYPESGPAEHQGKKYAVLRNVNGVLAVYRVRTSGALKRLQRWPKEIETCGGVKVSPVRPDLLEALLETFHAATERFGDEPPTDPVMAEAVAAVREAVRLLAPDVYYSHRQAPPIH
jgi:hypothetical protein